MKFGLKLAAGAAALAMLGAAPAGQAAIVNWTITNGHFTDGGLFSGLFTVDTSIASITDWSLQTTNSVGGHVSYQPGGNPAQVALDTVLGPTFSQGSVSARVTLMLNTIDLTGPGSVAHLTGNEVISSNGALLFFHQIVDGQAVGVLEAAPGVPEPAAWSLMIVGAALTGAALRRGRRTLAA